MRATRETVCVIGATGAQGIPVVRVLTRDGKYTVRAVTRNASSPDAKLLASWPNVTLCVGNVYEEKFLRQAFQGTQLAFVNTNGYVTGEKGEIYWGMRIYEIAIQNGIKHYVWGSLDYATKKGGFDDRFRCGHFDGKGKVADWLLAQPRSPIVTSVLTSGPYMELLFEFLLPKQRPDGVFEFMAPLGPNGAIPLIHLEDLGRYARWIFDNGTDPAVNGMNLEVATEHVEYNNLVATFSKITGQPAVFVDVTMQEYFEKYYPAGPKAVKRKIGTMAPWDDTTLQTWGQNFSGFWYLWRYSGGNKGVIQRDYNFLDQILPDRVRNVEEWMRKVNYDGKPRHLLKDWSDGGIGAKGDTAAVKL